jgi:carotenoid cleavage dioxygenase
MNGNVMSFFPAIDEPFSLPKRGAIPSYFARFSLNPNATDLRLPDPDRIGEISGEFSRIDDRFQGEPYDWTFIAATDATKPYDQEKSHGRPFMGFNSVGRMNNKTKTTDYWWAGPCASVGEPCFIPRDKNAKEGDGYVVSLVNRFDTNLSSLVVLDTRDFQREIAMVHLPFRVRAGFHGNWVNREEMGNVEDSLVDMSWVPERYDGPVDRRIHGKPTDVVTD